MLAAAQLLKVLPGQPRIVMHGPWYRAVAFDHLPKPPPGPPAGRPIQPLWPGGASLRGARLTPPAVGVPGLPSLYLAQDEMTPLLEVTGVLKPPRSPVALVFEPQVLMTVDGSLTDILDVTDPSVQAALETSTQELTGNWALQQADYLAGKGSMPPTQALGEAAYQVGCIVGLKYRSSKNVANGYGVVVFSDRMTAAGNYLELFNQSGGYLQQRLP